MSDNNKYAMLTDPDMKEIVESFAVESNEILEQLDSDLVQLESKPEDDELLNKIFRAFHTIKGTSGFLGLEKLTAVTHRCEDILNKLRKGDAKLSSNLMDVILLAYDSIKELIHVIENNHNEDVNTDDTVQQLEAVVNNLENPKVDPVNNGVKKKTTKRKTTKKTITNNKSKKDSSNEQDMVEEILPAGEIEVESGDKLSPEEKRKADVIEKTIQKHTKMRTEDSNIRVDVERLNELLNIVSELVLGRNQLAQVYSEIALEYEGTKMVHDLGEVTKQIDLMTNELQLVVMKTRMVKVGKVFNRFPRVVRDLSKEMGKKVNLIINGEETELDKTLIEEINDPLVHLIRNSVDHGIESPDERKKKGKDPVGTLILSADQEGNNIIITVEDDGKGIDPNVIKVKAIEKGLITEEKAEVMSTQETFGLIFSPGFSTASVVTNVSGRGVGMDVVRTNVAKLRGIINIDSTVDTGTKIIIKLPLTLAIIAGMVVREKEEIMVVPLSSVVEVLRVHCEDIYTINGNEVIKVRDRVLPLIAVNKLLYNKEVEEEDKVFQFIVVVGIAEKEFGIKVDEMIGQKEVVIKSLGNYLGNIPGIAGSSIMGDGRVVMILDIAELLNKLNEEVETKN